MDAKSLLFPLLTDRRLTMPTIKFAGLPGMAGAVASNIAGPRAAARAASAGADLAAGWAAKAAPAPKSMLDHASGLGRMGGAALGGSVGALKGFVDPGTEYDERGNPHTKSRIMGALNGGSVGAGAGFLAAPMIRGGAGLLKQNPAALGGAGHALGGTAPAAPATPPAGNAPATMLRSRQPTAPVPARRSVDGAAPAPAAPGPGEVPLPKIGEAKGDPKKDLDPKLVGHLDEKKSVEPDTIKAPDTTVKAPTKKLPKLNLLK